MLDLKTLLREPLRQLQGHVHRRLLEAGHTDLRPAHANVLQHLGFDTGLRIQELANRAPMAWQSMAELVEQLERGGYVERRPDPTDRRARLVSLTERGRQLVPIAVEAMREVEAASSARIGERDLEVLRTTLQRLWPAVRPQP